MKRSISRFYDQGPVVDTPKATVGLTEAKRQLGALRVNMESSLSLHRGVSGMVNAMRDNPIGFRGSRVKAFDLLRGIAAKKVGKEVTKLDMESFGVTGFVSEAVKVNLESAEDLAEAVEEQVKPEANAAECADQLFLNVIEKLKKAQVDFDTLLQHARDGVAGEYVTGIEGFRIESYLTGEGSEPETDAGKALAASLKQRKEDGDKITFDVDKESGSVVIVMNAGLAVNSDVSNFPFTFYSSVRKALMEDANRTDTDSILLLLEKNYSAEQLQAVAMNVYANSSFAAKYDPGQDFKPQAKMDEVLVKSYDTNQYGPMVEIAEKARVQAVGDLKLLCEAPEGSDKVAATTLCSFLCRILAILD